MDAIFFKEFSQGIRKVCFIFIAPNKIWYFSSISARSCENERISRHHNNYYWFINNNLFNNRFNRMFAYISFLIEQSKNYQENQVLVKVHDAKIFLIKYVGKNAAFLALQVHFFICINSLYHKIKEENNRIQANFNVSTIQQQLSDSDNGNFQSLPMFNEAVQKTNPQIIVCIGRVFFPSDFPQKLRSNFQSTYDRYCS